MSLPLARRPVRFVYLFFLGFFLFIALFWHQRDTEWASNTFGPRLLGAAHLNKHVHRHRSANAFTNHISAITRLGNLSLADAQTTCTWSDDESKSIKFQFTGFEQFYDTSWMKNDWKDDHLSFHKADLNKFLREGMIPFAKIERRLDNGGIVIAANGKSLDNVKVILRQLRRLGSVLPVEIYFWAEEITATQQSELKELWGKTSFFDLSMADIIYKTSAQPKIRTDWNFKTAALLNSRFAQILLLDSDTIPVTKPEDLFLSKTYQEFGTVFWPDITRTRPNNPIWSLSKSQCRMDEYEQDGGQVLIDKRRFWYHLQLAMFFLNDMHWKFYGGFFNGDKDAYRFAWKTLKTQYGTPHRWLSTVGFSVKKTASAQETFCGVAHGQYFPDVSPAHPNGQIAFLHAKYLKQQPAEVKTWLRRHGHGVFSHIKRSPNDTDPSYILPISLLQDKHDYIPMNERVGNTTTNSTEAYCLDFPGIEARPLQEVIPGGFDTIMEQLDGSKPGPGAEKEKPSL